MYLCAICTFYPISTKGEGKKFKNAMPKPKIEKQDQRCIAGPWKFDNNYINLLLEKSYN